MSAVTASAVPMTVTVAASPRDMPRLRHHEANRILEDEREEDADEHDQERVADRRECDGEAERPEHEEQRAHRQEELDASRVRRVHGAKGYGAVRLERPCRLGSVARAAYEARDRPREDRDAQAPEARLMRARDDLAVAPHFSLETRTIPRHALPEREMAPDVAYQIIHDELMLDGNARLNVATFVSTWMEPQAEKLMAECFDKNMIDKDEYPQTAEIEMRCVNILANLWHAPDADEATGCSTTGSSEAAMLGGLALKRRWQKRRAAEGKPTDKPNLVMGINVQICWEKFANYWDVEMRLVPMEGERFNLSAEEAVKRCDENTIGVVAILGSTFDGSYEPVKEICDALDAFEKESGDRRARARRRRLRRDDRSVPRSGPRVGLPPPARGVHQHLRSQVRPRLPRRRLDRLARRGRAAGGPDLLGQLPR